MEREYGQSPDYASDGNRHYLSHTNPGYRNNLSDGYNVSGQGMNRAARGYTSSARGGGFIQHFDTHLHSSNNNDNYRQDYNMHADRNIENAYTYAKTTVGPSDTTRGPFRSTSESLTNTNPSETLKAYQQNTGQHGRDFDSVKGFEGSNDYQGLGSTNSFSDQVYEKVRPDQGRLDRGFADENTGTKTTKTMTRTFCEMATQTTEDDMPESTYNGVSVVSVTRTSIMQPAAVEQVPKPHRALDQLPSHVARPSNMTRDTRDTRDVREMELRREMEPKGEVDPRRVQTTYKDEPRDYTNRHNRSPSNPPPTSNIEINQRMSKPIVPISDGNQAAGDGWGNVAANKAIGEMVDWSSGAVIEFPEEAKSTVTNQWSQSRVQKAPVQPLRTSRGPPKKEESKAEQTYGQPSTSNLGWNNQRNVAQPQGRSVQDTKPTNESPWLEDHQEEKKSTIWEISTTRHSSQDDQDAWVTEGNNNGGPNEWSFMADTANAAWNTPAPAPTSWGSTPGIKTLIATPELASSSSGPLVSVPPAQPTTSWDQPVSAPELTSTTWGQRISDAPEQPSTTWNSTSASPTSAKKVLSTSTERFKNSLQKLAAGYGGLSKRNNGSYEHTPQPAPTTTSRWAPSSSIEGSDNPVQTQPQQTHHRSTSSSSSTYSASNSSSPKVGPKDTPPPPVKAPVKTPRPNARRIQHNFANSPERESAAAAAWVAASKSFSIKPSGLVMTTTTATTTTTTTTAAVIETTSEGATPTDTQASKVTSRGGLLTTSNDFQSFLAASTFIPPALTSQPSSASEGDASEAKDDAVTDPEPEHKEDVGMGSNCGTESTTTNRSANKGSGRSVRGSGLSSTRGSEVGSVKRSEPSDALPSEPGDNAWGEPVEKGGHEAQDDGAPNLIVLEENDKSKESKKEVEKVVNKPVDRTYSGSPLATSNDFQSFLNASCKFVPPVPTKKETPVPEKISKDDEAKQNQTAVDPEPEVPKKEDEKKEEEEKEEEKHGEEKHEVEVEKQDEKEEKEEKAENHEDMGSDDGRQLLDDRSAKGLGPCDSGQPSEPVERRQEAKDDGAHLNLIALEECDKEANKVVTDKLLQEASDKLEALQKAGQVETKVADETALPVSPEVSQDSPIEPKVPEASLSASPEVRQDSPAELKAAAEASLLVSPTAPLDGQAELEVAAETTLPVSPSALEETGPVNFQIAETAVSVSPVS